MNRLASSLLLFTLAALAASPLAACSGGSSATGAGGDDGGADATLDGSHPSHGDASLGNDASPGDTGAPLDAPGSPDTSPVSDAGADTATTPDADAASPTDASEAGSDGGVDASDAGCLSAPVFHPDGGIYCPYTASDAGTFAAARCAQGQLCCQPPPGSASTCESLGTPCPVVGSVAWACDSQNDCTNGAVCCFEGQVSLDPVCAYARAPSGFTGSHCVAACGAGEVRVCESQGECASGTCTPFRAGHGMELGACL